MSLTSSPPSISPRQSQKDLDPNQQSFYRNLTAHPTHNASSGSGSSSSPSSSSSHDSAGYMQSTTSASGSSSPEKHRSRSNTLTQMNENISKKAVRPNAVRSNSSKSAPTSPSGRIVIQGLTPLNHITASPLDQLHPQSLSRTQLPVQSASRQNALQAPYQHQPLRPGSMGPPVSIPAHHALHQQRPSHIHSHSLPPANPLLALPSSSTSTTYQPTPPPTHFPAALHNAGPSRQNSYPYPNAVPIPIPASANASHLPSAKSVMRVRPRQSFSSARSNGGEDSGIDSDATVRPGGKSEPSRHKGSLSQPDLTVLRSKRIEGWTENMRGAGAAASSRFPQSQAQAQAASSSSSSSSSTQAESSRPSGELKRRASGHRQKTPPASARLLPAGEGQSNKEGWLPASPTHSRSYSSLSSLRKSPSTSPRSSQLNIPTMSPITPNRVVTPLSNSSSEDEEYVSLISNNFNRPISAGHLERGSSEDADDDFESTSTSTNSPGGSSGSITFSPKRTRKFGSSGNLRQRFPLDRKGSLPSISSASTTSNDIPGGGLGLNLNGDLVDMKGKVDKDKNKNAGPFSATTLDDRSRVESKGLIERFERLFHHSTLLPLRLLAVIPSLWGICVLAQALITGGLWVDVWPWGVDLSREALERLVAGGENTEGVWKKCDRGDALLCIAWAICTAHFCFSLTTGLTHRWRSYYSLPSTITRLVSLQCLCWPATYLTLWFLGANRLLLCWVVIGVTTGWSRTVQMWVTSNVIPLPPRSSASASRSNTGLEREEKEGVGGQGDITPNSSTVKITMGTGPPEIPDGLSTWEAFRWGRKWDWDNVARAVGWKVGGLLLITCAWLFWGIENGMRVRG
ncbi:uncharacterized protein I303_106698 [Kwoniella dejecticola CBS 10117]|uniref:N-glycosylation protein EOS1 n=1 Tax=Kwoniella dejecticola CBS 10117 TaxID=1296121 RepID=A0A1A5ZTY3_9TREE|nr:uncharacterized protein I303_08660 [Kwoniella dejecticola CBS 10117]OBR81274.1 hypothetical protein I303_08660 [Kwoniella dejecticola CBS 10117]